MCSSLGPLQTCPLSGEKLAFSSKSSCTSIPCLCRPDRACFFLSAFSFTSLNGFSPSGGNGGFHPPGLRRWHRIRPQLPHTAPTGPIWGFAGVRSFSGSQNRKQGHTRAFLFLAHLLSTFPLRGKAGLFPELRCPGFPDSPTTAPHGSNRAGLRSCWCPFPYLSPKVAHRASQARV